MNSLHGRWLYFSPLALGVVCVLLLFMAPHGTGPLRAVTGIPFLGIASGFPLVCVVYDVTPCDRAFVITLSVAASLTLTIAVAIAAHATGMRMTGKVVTTGDLAVVALVTPFTTRRPAINIQWRGAPSYIVASGGVLLAFVMGVLVLARPLPNTRIAGYSALGVSRTASGLQIYILNATVHRQTYRVTVKHDGRVLRIAQVAVASGAKAGLRLNETQTGDISVTLSRLLDSDRFAMVRRVFLHD